MKLPIPTRSFHRSPASAIAILAAAASLTSGEIAGAATACYEESCATSCSPQAPVEISTLIGPGDFPAGADTPTAFVDPGDGRARRLVATQEGAILVWNGLTGEIEPTIFLDLRQSSGGPVQAGGEQGLLSLAVEPDYRTTGRFYVYYTRRNLGAGTANDIVIARYERSAGNPDVANATETQILVIEHSGATNHNGGTLAFGPDGFLYASIGDGGPQCDNGAGASGDGQSPGTLLGKVLRLDVRNVDPDAGGPDDCGVGGTGNYEVPSTNPFFGQEPACDEVWALGLRNPFRMTFDRDTGDLYIGDVGQNKWEEIELKRASTPAPVNFGWVCREGCETGGNDESGCSTAGCSPDPGDVCEFPRASGFWDPILCHYNGGWDSIMGGYRYRGVFVPSIAGDYVYGDAACGQLWKTTTLDPANPGAITAACWASGYGGTYGFGEDGLGELYVVAGGASRIDCIHNGDGCFWANSGLFEDGFETENPDRWSETVP